MTHPGKAALHRLALRRTEKVGDTGVTLGSIIDYVSSLETEIDRFRDNALGSEPVGFADPVDIRVTGRAFDVRRNANGRYSTALYTKDAGHD